VERVEVVPDRLDLSAVDDLVAEAEEDVLDFAADLRQGMEMTAPHRPPGQGDVERLVEPLQLLERYALRRLMLGFLEPYPERIERPAGVAIPNLSQGLRQRGPSAQIRDVRVGQLLGGVRG